MVEPRRALAAGVTVGGLLLLGLSGARAAEMRGSVDGQAIVRTLAYAEPIVEPELVAPPAPEELAPGTDAAWLDGSCEPACCPPCPPVDSWAYWGRFDFLLWWRRDQDLPPLVTSSPADTPFEQAGVLGEPTTRVLYGRESSNGGATAGGRLTVGAWTDCSQMRGIGLRLYGLGNSRSQFRQNSSSTPILARPFFNLTLGTNSADVVTFPTESTGSVTVSHEAQAGGGDAFLRRLCYADACHRIDLLLGYQLARIDEDLSIATNRRVIRQDGSIPFGTVVASQDRFETQNTYHAFAIGMIGEYDQGHVTWRLLAKVGLGNMRQEVLIDGLTSTAIPGQPVFTTPEGLLARASNSGSYSRDTFAVAPEIGLNLAYHLNANCDVTVGYSFLYWNRVVLPASQVDLGIDTRDGATRPAFVFADSDYLLHGLNIGFQWVY